MPLQFEPEIMMRRVAILLLALALVGPWEARADLAGPDGTWLVSQRVAFDVFPCQNALCGRIVWLRDPSLRTTQMCGRTIIWGLTSSGPAQWGGGWFFDPENGSTYNVSAQQVTPDELSARIYRGFSMFGRTEILTRIAPHSREGWCGS